MKRELPLFITAITGIIIIINFIFPELTGGITETLRDWTIMISSFAIILGILNLIIVNLRKSLEPITHLEDRIFSLIVILSLVITTIIGLVYGIKANIQNLLIFKINDNYVFPLIEMEFIKKDMNLFTGIIFNSIYTPLNSATFSLLAFFIASAAYRAFRAKNFEALILLLSATIIMLGRVPIGDYLFSIFGIKISIIADYIISVLNAAAQRAILIAIGIGTIIISLKLLFGVEKSHIGKSE
jgi:hypothetical protein